MKKTVFLFTISSFIAMTSCNNNSSSESDNSNCAFDGIWTCYNCSDIYELSSHNIYSLISGTGKTNTQINFPAVAPISTDEVYFDPPNKDVGEFDKIKIVEISNNHFYLKNSIYDNDYPDIHMDFEIEEYEIIKGSLNDYQNGKEIILGLTENGKLASLRNLEKYEKAILESYPKINDVSLKDRDQMTVYNILMDKNRLVMDFGDIKSYTYSGHLSESFCAQLYE